MSDKIRPIALVDCNNFFVSCERAFQPWLEEKPLVVLSGDGGHVVSRSEEAKALGIEMGAPYSKIRGMARQHGIEVRAPNFPLYGDMSRRVVDALETISDDVDIHSIDECFMGLDPAGDTQAQGRQIRARVLQWTGIPACVGIGPTRTLAKLANNLAKKHPEFRLHGVCDLTDTSSRERLLPLVRVSEIRGVDGRMAKKLNHIGIFTAAQLRDTPLEQMRGILSAVGERIVEELRGTSCLSSDLLPAPQKGMAVTRSFKDTVKEEAQVRAALASFVKNAVEKLHRQGLKAQHMQVFLRCRDGRGAGFSTARTVSFETPDNHGVDFARAVAGALREIWAEGHAVAKAGILLSGLVPQESCVVRRQASLLGRRRVSIPFHILRQEKHTARLGTAGQDLSRLCA